MPNIKSLDKIKKLVVTSQKNLTVSEIGTKLGLSLNAVNFCVDYLSKEGLLEVVTNGRVKIIKPNREAKPKSPSFLVNSECTSNKSFS